MKEYRDDSRECRATAQDEAKCVVKREDPTTVKLLLLQRAQKQTIASDHAM